MRKLFLLFLLLLATYPTIAQTLPITPQQVQYDANVNKYFRPKHFIPLGDKLVFIAQKKGTLDSFALCYYDSVSNIAHKVLDSLLQGISNIGYLIPEVHNGKIYFSGIDQMSNSLYSWNGSDTVQKICTEGLVTPVATFNSPYAFWGDTLFFMGYGGATTQTAKGSLYKLNTINNNLQNLTPGKTYNESGIVLFKNKVYFSEMGAQGKLFYFYDPNSNKVYEATLGVNPNDTYNPFFLKTEGKYIFFTAHSNLRSNTHLYAYEEGAGIKWVNDLKNPGSNIKGNFGTTFSIYDSSIIFCGAIDSTTFTPTDPYSFNPYTSDMRLIKKMNGKDGSIPNHFTVIENKLYFSAKTNATGTQVYQYDKVADSVIQITNYGNMPSGLGPNGYTQWGSYIYFAAYEGISTSNWKDTTDMYRIPVYHLPQQPNSISKQETQTISATLYPNPTNGDATLNISLDKTQTIAIQLVDINGRVVFAKEAQPYNSGTHTITIPMQELPAGTYIYTLKDNRGNTVSNGKLSKE